MPMIERKVLTDASNNQSVRPIDVRKMMKTNSSSSASPTSTFDLIPEEEAEPAYDMAASQSQTEVAAAAAAAAATCRLFQVQQMTTGEVHHTPFIPEFALQQHVLQQVKHQQLLQQQILEQQIQRSREILNVEHERQLSVFFHQIEAKRKATEAVAVAAAAAAASAEQVEVRQQQDKMRLEQLKSKSRQEQSAVASPEVKRHLAEFVLKKKNKEAGVGSMTNLKMSTATHTAPSTPPHAHLRKTASESNLLKMKPSKRAPPTGAATPYQRAAPQREHSLRETTPGVGSSCGSLQESPVSNGSSASSTFSGVAIAPPHGINRPQDLSMVAARFHSASGGSAPTSPKTLLTQSSFSPGSTTQMPTPITLASRLVNHNHPRSVVLEGLKSSTLNSKSLPNIPSVVNRLVNVGKLGRKSPPSHTTAASNIRPPPHHSAMLVRRSKSSAILPLRKHLIEKTLAEQKKSMDEEQFYFQQKQKMAERLLIRPIEEVMEEDSKPMPMGAAPPAGRLVDEEMEVEDPQPRTVHSFAARLGHAGLSPLVLGDVGATSCQVPYEYIGKLLPFHPSHLSYSAAVGRTGLGYDPVMLKHQCLCENIEIHPENPSRLGLVWNHLVDCGLADECVQVARMASLEEICSVHSEAHTLTYGTDMLAASQSTPGSSLGGKLCLLNCGGYGVDPDTYWNDKFTGVAARTAVGTVIELSSKVASGELKNGFALVRPPGHHAEREEAMGFCFFNSIAIAAKQLLHRKVVRRVLIIDWAIHHGNGTQQCFYDNPNVLYISLHRHDNGNFYPGTGGPVECGTDQGHGFNVNIGWTGGLDPPMGDAEYLAAFRSIVLPIAKNFDPDIVLVSAGFDAAIGHPHPIGGYTVSTACFAFLTLQLRQIAQGKVVLALEGGYNTSVLCTGVEQCVRALVGLPIDKISEAELARRPCHPATETLQKTMAIHSPHWPILRKNPGAALLSHLEAWEKEKEQSDAITAMAGLSMKHQLSLSSRGSSCSIADPDQDGPMGPADMNCDS